MFGIGPMEMGIIAVVALLIFGPEKLPEMMGQAGKMVRDFRKLTAEMSGEFEKTIAEAKSVTKDIQGEVGSMRSQVNSVSKSIQNDLGGKKSTSKATTATKRGTGTGAAKKGGSSSTTARKSSTTAKGSGTTGSAAKDTAGGTSTAAKKTSTTTAAPAAPQQATREDPTAAVSLFEPSAPRRERRTRQATLSMFGEATPRTPVPVEAPAAADAVAADAVPTPIDLNDPLVRARQRRQSAGYARKIS